VQAISEYYLATLSTSKERVVVFVTPPPLPVKVILDVPVLAVLETVRV
jgi:hypothetical protein